MRVCAVLLRRMPDDDGLPVRSLARVVCGELRDSCASCARELRRVLGRGIGTGRRAQAARRIPRSLCMRLRKEVAQQHFRKRPRTARAVVQSMRSGKVSSLPSGWGALMRFAVSPAIVLLAVLVVDLCVVVAYVLGLRRGRAERDEGNRR